jgi:chromosomal replication initiation ATPase DnaA
LPRQFRLPLTVPPRWDRESFASSPTNAEALEGLDAWPAWPDGRLALVGPAGTGKTHLARDWARRVSAVVIEAASTVMRPWTWPPCAAGRCWSRTPTAAPKATWSTTRPCST